MTGKISLLLTALLLTSCFGGKGKKQRLGEVRKGDVIQKITIAGLIEPKKRTQVVAPYDGYVRKLFVSIGDEVKEGDPLVTVSQSLTAEEKAYPLRAPFSGKVVQVLQNVGDFVRRNDDRTAILRVDDLTNLYIDANVPEVDYPNLKLGQTAVIKSVAILSKTYEGKVIDVFLAARQKERWSRSDGVEYPIRIEILNEDQQIKPGMSVLVDIETAKKEGVLVLEHEYLEQRDGEYYVTTNKGESRKVRLGLINETVAEVLDIPEGTKVRQIDFYNVPEKKR